MSDLLSQSNTLQNRWQCFWHWYIILLIKLTSTSMEEKKKKKHQIISRELINIVEKWVWTRVQVNCIQLWMDIYIQTTLSSQIYIYDDCLGCMYVNCMWISDVTYLIPTYPSFMQVSGQCFVCKHEFTCRHHEIFP